MTARLLNGAEAPFADVFAPAVAAAGANLVLAGRRAFSGAAAAGLLRCVGDELGSLAAPTLLRQFSRMSSRTSCRADSHTDVAAFTGWLTAGGLSEIVAERPELDRILGHHLARAISRTAELLVRLEEGRSTLEGALGFRLPVVDVVPLVNGAYVLTDTEGHRVLYKRRPLDMDAALSALLRHVNECGWGPALPTAGVVHCGDHGFMEHVQARPPSSKSDLFLMCEQFGMVLAIATVLGAADLHGHNIIVGTDGPVIIDAEAMLRPPWSEEGDREASVHASAILPMSNFVHHAGLLAAFLPPRESPWCDTGSDAVRVRPVLPTLAVAERAAADHLGRIGPAGVRHVVAGFHNAYDGIIAHGLPLEVFADTCPRVLLRPSVLYEDIMLSSLSPEVLAYPGRRATLLERSLAAPPRPVAQRPHLAASVRRAEVRSLNQFEFPRFTMSATGGPLRLGAEVVGDAPFEAPLVRARRLVASATRQSRERHAGEIAHQLHMFVARHDPSPTSEVP